MIGDNREEMNAAFFVFQIYSFFFFCEETKTLLACLMQRTVCAVAPKKVYGISHLHGQGLRSNVLCNIYQLFFDQILLCVLCLR